MKAIWRDTVVADSDDVVEVDGIPYFPLADVAVEFLEATDTTGESATMGTAVYFSIVVADGVNPDAAWTYPKPGPDAREVLDRVAFAPSVSIRESPAGDELADTAEPEPEPDSAGGTGSAAAAELADEIDSIRSTERP